MKSFGNRQSIRLQGYDYSQPGAYFVTVCAKDKKHLFGEIVVGAAPTFKFSDVVHRFKSLTTTHYRKATSNPTLWQRNYYERVIRNENELRKMREYIQNNPKSWSLDPENPLVLK